MVILFLCTLPLVNPTVHGDGVGYYAYVRAPLMQHNLRFEEDWRHANLNFSQSRTTRNGEPLPSQYTGTGYVSNQFTVGPALLWAPFRRSTYAEGGEEDLPNCSKVSKMFGHFVSRWTPGPAVFGCQS